MKLTEKLQQIPLVVRKGVAIVVLAFVAGLLYPAMKEWFNPTIAPSTPPRVTLPAAGETLRTHAFTVELWQQLLRQVPEGNVVLTPNMLNQCLVQLQDLAAEEHAESFTRLQLTRPKTESTTAVHEGAFFFANEKDVLSHSATLQESIVYGADFVGDLAMAHKLLNTAVKNATDGMVPLMFNSTSAPRGTRLLGCAVAGYTADWYYPIYAHRTEKATFRNADATQSKVEMMRAEGRFRMVQSTAGNWKAVAIPMRNNPACDDGKRDSCALILIQPIEELPLSAHPLAEQLTQADFDAIRSALATAPEQDATIKLPRFAYNNSRLDVFPLLHAMGLGAITKRDGSPFPKISATQPFPLDGLYQQCTLVFKESPENATAPAPVGGSSNTLEFNRPFLWLLVPLTTANPPYAMGLVEYL